MHVLARKLGLDHYGNDVNEALVAMHMAYSQIQIRLGHFSRLVDIYPALLLDGNLERLMKQEGEMVRSVFITEILPTFILLPRNW